MPYLIEDDTGRAIDARIEMARTSVILHSRGGSSRNGTTRNEGHGPALIFICRRARSRPGSLARVLVDSAVARQHPEEDRILISRDEIETLDGDALAAAIRPRLRRFGQADGVKGGNSTKQVRLDFDLSPEAVVSLLRLRPGEFTRREADIAPARERLTTAQLRQVLPIHVRQAVDRLLAGEDASNFSESRDYDVVVSQGERLAPKKVFGLAIEEALGFDAFPSHFSAGWGQPCFETIQAAGFAIVGKSEPRRVLVTAQAAHPPEQEEQSWAEGSPQFAEHLRIERKRSRQASAAKRAQVRLQNGGRLACENPACTMDWYAAFPLPQAEAVFEIHHKLLVSEMDADHRTSLNDLACLCASCHRAEHRRLSIEAQ